MTMLDDRDQLLMASLRDGAALRAEIGRLRVENWQLKGALGYPVPSHIPEGDFKCGLCDARRQPPLNYNCSWCEGKLGAHKPGCPALSR